jgi:hypothetical protein
MCLSNPLLTDRLACPHFFPTCITATLSFL